VILRGERPVTPVEIEKIPNAPPISLARKAKRRKRARAPELKPSQLELAELNGNTVAS
jgi:hypothetical protein